MTAAMVDSSRRRFLKQGAVIVVGFTLVRASDPFAQQPTPAPALPGSLQNNRMLDGWIAINPNASVTVFTGKVELGQGILTALAQIVADELDVDYARIEMISGDTERTPNEGVTSGSLSIQDSGTALRFAAAEARDILLRAVAAKLDVPVAELKVDDGTVTTVSGARAAYWDFANDGLLKREATAKARPKPSAQHRIIGREVQRRDIPAKVTGGAAYVQDMRLPNMVFGRVVRPPSPGAHLISVGDAAARRMPGVVGVVRDGDFLAVAALREEQAIAAMTALRKSAQWRETAQLPPSGRRPVRTYEGPAVAGFRHRRKIRQRGRRDGHQETCGALHAPVPGAWFDRTVVRGGAVAGRTPARLEPYPRCVSAARRPCEGAARPGQGCCGHAPRRLWLLRSQRRRRRSARCRPARARIARPPGKASMDEGGRIRLGALWFGHGDRPSGCAGREWQDCRLAARAVESHPQHATRRPGWLQSARVVVHARTARAGRWRATFRSRPAAAIAMPYRFMFSRSRRRSTTCCRTCRCVFPRCVRLVPTRMFSRSNRSWTRPRRWPERTPSSSG